MILFSILAFIEKNLKNILKIDYMKVI